MLRFYRDFIERLVMILVYMKQNGREIPQIAKGVNLDRIEDRTTQVYVNRAVEQVVAPDYPNYPKATLSDTIKALTDSLDDLEKGKPKDGDLIDLIVKALQLPYSRGAFTARMLADLRKVLLLPSEMAGLGGLKQREMQCVGCSHQFVKDEMATFHTVDQEVNIGFWCTNCMRPKQVACRVCGESLKLTKTVGRALTKTRFECDKHSNPVKEIDKQVVQQVVQNVQTGQDVPGIVGTVDPGTPFTPAVEGAFTAAIDEQIANEWRGRDAQAIPAIPPQNGGRYVQEILRRDEGRRVQRNALNRALDRDTLVNARNLYRLWDTPYLAVPTRVPLPTDGTFGAFTTVTNPDVPTDPLLVQLENGGVGTIANIQREEE